MSTLSVGYSNVCKSAESTPRGVFLSVQLAYRYSVWGARCYPVKSSPSLSGEFSLDRVNDMHTSFEDDLITSVLCVHECCNVTWASEH